MNKMVDIPDGMKVLISVVDHGRGDKLMEILDDYGVAFQVMLYGHGTANQEIMNLLGLGETRKDIVLSVVDSAIIEKVLELLQTKMHFDKPGRGIACSIPLESVGGMRSLQVLMGMLH